MEAQVTWNGRLSFSGTSGSGFIVPLGTSPEFGGDDDGFRPMELILIALAGCTAMDVISILQKKRQDVSSFEVKVNADRSSEHPKVFTYSVIEYIVSGNNLESEAVHRAVELSEIKYCPAQAMLSKAMGIERKITII